MKHLSQTIRIGLALLVAMFSGGLLPAATTYAYSTNPSDSDSEKVWVCKYVGTPGVNETLKSGQNPVSVDNQDYSLGTYFNDSQGRSYVVAWDPKDDKTAPNVSMCPAPDVPDSVTPTAPTVSNDACGVSDDTYTIPSSTGVIYKVEGVTQSAGTYITPSLSVHITAEAMQGYVLSGTTAWTLTFTDVACDESVTPTAPTVSYDACGVSDDTYTIPSTTGVIYKVEGVTQSAGTYIAPSLSVHITAEAMQGYVLSGTTAWTLTFTDVACDIPVTPIAPEFEDACGIENDDVILPEDALGVLYSIEREGLSVWVTATAANGYVLTPDATYEWDFTFTDTACKVTICHRTASTGNPYVKLAVDENAIDGIAGNSGRQADHYGEHTGPIYYDGVIGEWGDIIPPVEGAHFGLNWSTLGQFMLANNCEQPARTLIDFSVIPCVANAMTPGVVTVQITNPSDKTQASVTYTIMLGSVSKEVAIDDGDSAYVTFDNIASGLYTLHVTGTDGTHYVSEGSIEVPACAAPVFSPVTCDILMGSVRVTYDEEDFLYTISGTGIVGEVTLESGVAKQISKVGTYTVTAYSLYGEEMSQIAMWSHTYSTLTCGGGRGEVPTQNVAELPHTGSNDLNGLILALIAGIATYGAVYFAQPRRV